MFTGDESKSITLTEASEMTKKYRDSLPDGSRKCGFFGKNKLAQILNQEGCMGIRYYHGINKDGEPVIILVGADAEENDLYDGELLDFSEPCPTRCSENNPLNS
jgi:hypothetical protein